jgi:hypothetical protein
VLPALESFEKRWMLPKVCFLFYHYFFKAAVGDATYKSRLSEKKRLGPVILEAYTHATLYNQYFAWLYEYKANHPASTLVTQYDAPTPQAPDSSAEGGEEIDLFCGSLNKLEVSVPEEVPANGAVGPDEPDGAGRDEERQGGSQRTTTWTNFVLRLEQQEDEHEAAREHDQNIIKDIQRCIEADRAQAESGGGGGDTTVSSRLARYRYVQRKDVWLNAHSTLAHCFIASRPSHTTRTMSAKLVEDSSQPMMERHRQKRRRQSKSSLRDFTNKTRKTKKGTNEIKGWSAGGKKYVHDMMTVIKQDERNGVRPKWETMFETLSKMASGVNAQAEEDEEEETFEINESVLYEEV